MLTDAASRNRAGNQFGVCAAPGGAPAAPDAEGGGGRRQEANAPTGHYAGPFLVELLVAARAGDARAGDALYRALLPLVRRFLARRLANPRAPDDLLEDLTQEAIIRIAAGIRGCAARTDRDVRAWALTVARRAALDVLRAPATGMRVLWGAAALPSETHSTAESCRRQRVEVASADLARDHASETSAPTRAFDLLCRLTVEAQSTLSEAAAELLWAHLVERSGWPELALRIGTTPGGAKRRFQRAQCRLRQAVLTRIAMLPPDVRASVAALTAAWEASGGADASVAADWAGDRDLARSPSRRSPHEP